MSKVLYKTDNITIIGEIDTYSMCWVDHETKNNYVLRLTITLLINWKLKTFPLAISLKEYENTLILSDLQPFETIIQILNNLWYCNTDTTIDWDLWMSELISWKDWDKFYFN